MKKLKISVEDIESCVEYTETAKMLQDVYNRTGFLPNVFDCISPPETEKEIEDNNQFMHKPDEIDFFVAERWLKREGNEIVFWVTTEIIRPEMINREGKRINF